MTKSGDSAVSELLVFYSYFYLISCHLGARLFISSFECISLFCAESFLLLLAGKGAVMLDVPRCTQMVWKDDNGGAACQEWLSLTKSHFKKWKGPASSPMWGVLFRHSLSSINRWNSSAAEAPAGTPRLALPEFYANLQ